MTTSSAQPRVSVIVVTRQRRAAIEHLVADLAAQSLAGDAFEVVVVDDGSSDGTSERVKALAPSQPFALRLHTQAHQGPGAARNAGVKIARGQLLVFVDSDCRVEPSWLERLTDVFHQPDVVLAGGPEAMPLTDSRISRAAFFTTNSVWTTGGIRGRRGRSAGRYLPRTFNLAVTRPAFMQAGGFQRSAIYGEDIEFSHLVLSHGGRCVFVDDAPVCHAKPRSLRGVARQAFRIGRARFRMCRQYSALREPVYLLPSLWLVGVVGATTTALVVPGAGLLALASFAPFFAAAAEAAVRTGEPLLAGAVVVVSATQMAAYGAGFLAAAAGMADRRPSGGQERGRR